MTVALIIAGVVLVWVVFFGWLCEHAPVEDLALERRFRADCEVARLDYIWTLDAFDPETRA